MQKKMDPLAAFLLLIIAARLVMLAINKDPAFLWKSIPFIPIIIVIIWFDRKTP